MHRARWIAATTIVLLVSVAPRAQTTPPDVDARIATIVNSISEARMEQLMRTLVAFGTRNTLSDATAPARGIGAARQWIYDQLRQSSPRLKVDFDTHQIPKGGRITRDVELRNVVAILPGRSPRRIYVSGHYDTVNLGPQGQVGLNAGAGFGTPTSTHPVRMTMGAGWCW